MTRDDVVSVGTLYFVSYPPGVAGETVDDAIADVLAAMAGDYGRLRSDASSVAVAAGVVVAAVQVVDDPPWPDVQPGPFVIDLFTHPAHRGQGIARALLSRAMHACADAGCTAIGLRVESTNTAAVALYRSLGFVDRT